MMAPSNSVPRPVLIVVGLNACAAVKIRQVTAMHALCGAQEAAGGKSHLPDDGLADVGGDEERDAAAQAVALVEQLVQQQHDEAGNDQLRAVCERIWM